jgi:hypothetical protein
MRYEANGGGKMDNWKPATFTTSRKGVLAFLFFQLEALSDRDRKERHE